MSPEAMGGPIRIVLVDDHAVVREGLRLVLERQSDFDVLAESASATGAVELALSLRPDIVLMDIGLLDGDGVPAIEVLRARVPASRVIVLSMFSDAETVRQSLLAGASAYLVKGARSDELADAIRAVHRGERYLHSAIAGTVIDDSLRWLHEGAPLTPREREVLSLLADGDTAAGIGRALGISVHTVRRHLANSGGKLGVSGSRGLERYAREHGIRRQQRQQREPRRA